MKPVIRVFALSALVSASAFIPHLRAQDTDPSIAVQAVRVINTAEVIARMKNGRFVPFSELAKSGELQDAVSQNPKQFSKAGNQLSQGNPAEPVPGFVLRLVVSPEGSQYNLSLQQKGVCGKAFFSDDRGVIYEGVAFGCSATKSNSAP